MATICFIIGFVIFIVLYGFAKSEHDEVWEEMQKKEKKKKHHKNCQSGVNDFHKGATRND